MNEQTPMLDTNINAVPRLDQSSTTPLQPWTKPGFERMPLKDALTGTGATYTPIDIATYLS